MSANTPKQKSEQTEKAPKPKPAYEPPRIISHSKEEFENNQVNVNACASFVF